MCYCASTLRKQKEYTIPVWMFTPYWRCPSWNDLTIYLQNPFIKVNRKRVTWFPVEPLMMGTWLPNLRNVCPQACPYWCCAPVHSCILPLSPGLSFISSYSHLHTFSMLPCILESFDLVQQVILCAFNPFFLFFFIEKFCSYKGITKSW